MTIEATLERLINALEANTAALTQQQGKQSKQEAKLAVVKSDPVDPVQPAAVTVEDVVIPLVAAPVAEVAAVAPTVAPAVDLPFNDKSGIIEYTMQQYALLGVEKGALIQPFIEKCGAKAVTEIPVEYWPAYVEFIEGLKQ